MISLRQEAGLPGANGQRGYVRGQPYPLPPPKVFTASSWRLSCRHGVFQMQRESDLMLRLCSHVADSLSPDERRYRHHKRRGAVSTLQHHKILHVWFGSSKNISCRAEWSFLSSRRRSQAPTQIKEGGIVGPCILAVFPCFCVSPSALAACGPMGPPSHCMFRQHPIIPVSVTFGMSKFAPRLDRT
jgi:hypothetical protein